MLTQLTHIAAPLSRRRWLAAATGTILGLGFYGYVLSVDAAAHLVNKNAKAGGKAK